MGNMLPSPSCSATIKLKKKKKKTEKTKGVGVAKVIGKQTGKGKTFSGPRMTQWVTGKKKKKPVL